MTLVVLMLLNMYIVKRLGLGMGMGMGTPSPRS